MPLPNIELREVTGTLGSGPHSSAGPRNLSRRKLPIRMARQSRFVKINPQTGRGGQIDIAVLHLERLRALISLPIASKLTKYSVIRKFGMVAAAWMVAARPSVVLL